MAVAVLAVLAWRRWRGASWVAFGLGALAWVVGVALKFGWSLPTNSLIRQGLEKVLPQSVSAPAFWLYVGLLTGVFECGISLLFVKRTRLKSSGWEGAVAFGIGFGAVEAFLLGLIQFLGLLVAVAIWDRFPEDARTAFSQSPIGLGVAYVPLPIAERLSALLAHVFTCVLIVYGVRAGEQRWFWLAFVYKSVLDAFAAWGILATEFSKSISGMIAFESAIGVFAFLGLAGLAFLRGRF
ncbi:MAG TPA: YhfC family glutamic-type intramembrane protease [Pirellulales bacterium]|nr:YhfC family glutamic-type intramembrane protease [Pirellulales bacterium]